MVEGSRGNLESPQLNFEIDMEVETMNIVFTGAFYDADRHITRDKLRAMAENAGFTVEPRVSARTEMLVVGDTGRHGVTRKAQDAMASGIKLVDPQDFMGMING